MTNNYFWFDLKLISPCTVELVVDRKAYVFCTFQTHCLQEIIEMLCSNFYFDQKSRGIPK